MKNKRDQVSFYLLLLFLLPLLIFMLTFLIIYHKCENQVKEKTIEQTTLSLQKTIDYFDISFLDAYYSLTNAARQADIKNLTKITNDIQARDFAKMIKAQKTFSFMVKDTEIIENNALFFGLEKSFIIMPSRVLYDIENLFSLNIVSLGEYNYADLLKVLKETDNNEKYNGIPAGFIISNELNITNTSNSEVLPFVKRLNSASEETPMYGIIFLRTQKFEDLVLSENSKYFSYGISDYMHNHLCGVLGYSKVSIGKPTIIQEKASTVVILTSNLTKLNFIISIDNRYFKEKLSYFYLFYRLMLVVTLFVFLILAIIVVVVINHLSLILHHTEQKSNNMFKEFFKSSSKIEQTLKANNNMKKQLGLWEPIVKNEIIGRLLRDSNISEDELLYIPELIKKPEHVLRILTIEFLYDTVNPTLLNIFQKLNDFEYHIKKYFPLTVVHLINKSTFIVIINMPIHTDKITLNKYLDYGFKLASISLENCYVAIGGSYKNILNSYQSYNESCETLLQAKRLGRFGILWYDEYYKSKSLDYDFPYVYVNKLFNLLVSGEEDLANELFEQVVITNFSNNKQQISSENYRQFIFDLKGILLRVVLRIDEKKIAELLALYDDNMPINSCVTLTKEIFHQIVTTVKKQKRNELSYMMLDFINKYCYDSSMSLKLISKKFNLTEKYISAFFKKEIGCNFSDYTEKIRIAKAESLIKEGLYPITDIALRSGYSTISTFYKAFKRKHGVSPNKWKEI